MELRLRTVEDLAEAAGLAPLIEGFAAEFMAQFSDDDFPEGAVGRFLERHLEDPETVLVVASRGPAEETVGLCLTGPLEDPLMGTRLPIVLVLHVLPDARHRGLASELVTEARARLAARGLHRLGARVGHNDDALISMGERWGFVRLWELVLRE